MANKEEKALLIQGLKEKLQLAKIIVFTNFQGLNAQEITELRQQFRRQALDYHVVKNSLLLRALDGFPTEDMAKYLQGPTAVAIGYDDPLIPAKVLANFSQSHPQLQIKGGYMEGVLLESEMVTRLARLPSPEVLKAQVLFNLQRPLRNLIMVLRSPLYKLMGSLEAIKSRVHQ